MIRSLLRIALSLPTSPPSNSPNQPSSPMTDRASLLASAAVLSIAATILLTTLVSAAGYHVVGPVRDLWTIVPRIGKTSCVFAESDKTDYVK